jgi:hypothetical protein
VGFLAPAFLGLAALAGVPILVHFLRRRIARRVEFPAVRYLARMEQEHSRDLKLKNRLLLLLRIIAVLALALAAARPIARLAGLGHAPVAIAVVVDNSMSSSAVSGGRQRLDVLKQEADALVASLDANDRSWIVTADGRVVGGSHDAVRQALRALQPLGGRGDLDAAARRALTLARSGAPRAGVVAIVSDGQANAFGSANDSIIPVDRLPVVAFIPDSIDLRNTAVLGVRVDPERWTPTGSLRMQFAGADSLDYRVIMEGRTVTRGQALPGTVLRPSIVDVRLSSAATGWVRGHVEIDPDDLRADDVRHFVVRVAPPPTVALRGEAGPFLGVAVNTLSDEGRVSRSGVTSSTITVTAADAAGTRTPIFLTAPLDPVRVGEANRALARLNIPWRFGAIARNGVNARVHASNARDTAATPTRVALDGARVLLRYPLMASPGTGAASGVGSVDTIAMAGGTPWVVAGPGYVLVGSPLDPDATDLPVRAGFVPWLLETFSHRLGSDGLVIHSVPGQRIEQAIVSDGIENAEGTVTPWNGSANLAPQQAGVYFLRRGADRIGALVVNAEPEESDVGVVDGATFMSRFEGGAVSAHASGDAWRRAVLSQAQGRALVVPLVLLALLALALEAWFARSMSVQGPVTTTPASARRAA